MTTLSVVSWKILIGWRKFLILSHCETMIRKLIKWAVVEKGWEGWMEDKCWLTFFAQNFRLQKRFREQKLVRLSLEGCLFVGPCLPSQCRIHDACQLHFTVFERATSFIVFDFPRRAFTSQRHRVKKSSRHRNRTVTLKGITQTEPLQQALFFGFNIPRSLVRIKAMPACPYAVRLAKTEQTEKGKNCGSKSLMNLFMDQQFVNVENKSRTERGRPKYTFPSCDWQQLLSRVVDN